jgi:hypothetical protein
MVLLNSIKRKIFLAGKISLTEWLLLAEAWLLLIIFYLALRWLSYDRLNKFVPKSSSEFSNSSNLINFAERLKQLVEISARLHSLPMTCLVKSFTLRWMLIRRGIPVSLRIGVVKTITGMSAHAWVELNDNPIGELQDVTERFNYLSASITDRNISTSLGSKR